MVDLISDVWTDEQIRTAGIEEWLGVLAQLWEAYGKPLDPGRMSLYRRSLGMVPLGLLEAAIDRVIREHTYNTVPTLGNVWGAVRTELKLAGFHADVLEVEDAIAGWIDQRLERCVVRFGEVRNA